MNMSVIFSCQCGKRLKAREGLYGKPIRCPQCGARVLVPDVGPATSTGPESPQENDSPFALDDGSETLPEPAAAEAANEPPPLAFPWLEPPRTEPGTVAEPLAFLGVANAPKPPQPAQPFLPAALAVEPQAPAEPAALSELVVPVVEPIRAAPARGGDAPLLAPGLREPWYLKAVEGFAHSLRLSAILAMVIVPAGLLVAGLVALARTGDPKSALAVRYAGIQLLPALLVVAGLVVATAVLWAAPFLLVVDLWRRYRAMSVRLDAFLSRQTQASTPNGNPEADAASDSPVFEADGAD